MALLSVPIYLVPLMPLKARGTERGLCNFGRTIRSEQTCTKKRIAHAETGCSCLSLQVNPGGSEFLSISVRTSLEVMRMQNNGGKRCHSQLLALQSEGVKLPPPPSRCCTPAPVGSRHLRSGGPKLLTETTVAYTKRGSSQISSSC